MEGAPSSHREIGRYSLYGEIASGGMATVYVGRLNAAGGFGRIVAIKRLHAQFARDPEFVSMFLDEARLAARIHHPNVVPTLDVVQSESELFVVMEYIRGESLSKLCRATAGRDGRIPVPIVSAMLGGVLQGLHAAHEAKDEQGKPLGIVHRDVSPQNVLVGEDGVARVLDFGVAKAASRLHQTREGQIKGKLGYMAPEQVSDNEVTAQSDIYAAGIVLWEALTGRFLFRGKTDGETLHRIVKREVEPPSSHNPDVPPALDAAVMRALELLPEARFATAREMALAVDAAVRGASNIEVGEWVVETAASTLESRHQMVRDIESGNVDSLSGFPVIPGGMLGDKPSSAPRAAQTEGQLGTAVTLHSNTKVTAPAPRSRRWLVLALTAMCAGAVAGLALHRGWLGGAPPAAMPAATGEAASSAAAGPADPRATADGASGPAASAPAATSGASTASVSASAESTSSAAAPSAKSQPSARGTASAKTKPTAKGGHDLDSLIETRK